MTRLVEVTGESTVRISGPDEARVLWRGPSGGTGTIIAATEPPWAAELWRWTLQPGEGFGGDAHMPATRELAWVQEGTLTLTVAGEQHQVTAGQSARFPGGVPHAYRNDGSAPVSLTMIVVVPPALE
jgi:mannose-6-phosphate isomerase-like protein (cupin superfamily)